MAAGRGRIGVLVGALSRVAAHRHLRDQRAAVRGLRSHPRRRDPRAGRPGGRVVAGDRRRPLAARRRGAPDRARRRRGHLPLVPGRVGPQLSADAGGRARRPRPEARHAGAAVRLRDRHRRGSQPSAADRARRSRGRIATPSSRRCGRPFAPRCLGSASARTSCRACRSGRCCSPTSAGRGSTASPTRSCRRSSSTTICCRWSGPSPSRTSGDTWPVSPTKPRRAMPAGSSCQAGTDQTRYSAALWAFGHVFAASPREQQLRTVEPPG